MELYILKSAACLAILFVFYKLVLERSTMHFFKRIYLLSALIISIIFPLITFTTYVTAAETTIPAPNPEVLVEVASNQFSIWNYLPVLLWGMYFAGFLFFSIRFIRNLLSIFNKIKNNPVRKERNVFHVLLSKSIVPHTFFSYIFLNKTQYDAKEIPKEVLLHEQAHASEKHSVDLIFAELIKLVFWFNPFIWLFKSAIKLNHEFLADTRVLKHGINPIDYQQKLVAFSTAGDHQIIQHNALANANTYSFIKKRLTVMKTRTTKRGMWLRSLVILPLLSLMLLSFSNTRYVVVNPIGDINPISQQDDKKIILYIKKKQISLNGEEVSVQNFAAKVDAITKNWSEADLRNFRWDIILEKADDDVINKLQKAYTTTRLYRYNPEKAPFPPPPPPPPPPASDAPKAPKVVKGVNDKDDMNPPPPPKAPIEVKQGVYELPSPPPPPDPDPIKYIENLAKGGATFYWGPHEVSKEVAIKMFKKNKNFGIDASEFPIVRVGGG
ncbi:M56 family metallopeptidase [Constantimarinum furrinae]|uniref:Membrane protein n=1 Tax=Constantimarinum furrinae TaxID=2562285 RepID=A0A7G8PS44_9FLAO|nr:M56 family metallopeptidase [Constantimarinum furrinae]QNJ97160.1 Membrane protein [Constantimarinum furrinae]